MTNTPHQELRDKLGAHLLGLLDAADSVAVNAHLDQCAECRHEMSELEHLPELLDGADVGRVDHPAFPPADLGDRILSAIGAEQRPRHRPRARAAMFTLAAAFLAIAGFGLGMLVAPWATGPPTEAVQVATEQEGIDADAQLIDHTWGMEIKLAGTGFQRDAAYRVVVTTEDGDQPSGAFVGTGPNPMNCSLNSAVLRDNATGFQVLDDTGDVVASSSW